jgi:hypothetical protein
VVEEGHKGVEGCEGKHKTGNVSYMLKRRGLEPHAEM